MKAGRSAGAVALARLGKTQDEIAARVSVSRQLVSYWLTGQRKPSAPNRAALLRIYNIGKGLWDELPATTPTELRPPPKHADGGTTTVREEAETLMRQVRALRDRVESAGETVTPLEQAKVYASAASTLTLLGKLTGETQEMSEPRLLRLPAFRRIEAAIVQALRPWPDAMRTLGETLKAME